MGGYTHGFLAKLKHFLRPDHNPRSERRRSFLRPLQLDRLEPRRVLATFGFTPQFAVEVESDIVYRDDAKVGHGTAQGIQDKELKLDLYKPLGDNLPTLLPGAIVIHGGGFVGGDKAASHFVDLSNDFASRGYVTVSINYRLFGDNPPPAKETPFSDLDERYDTFVAGVEDAFHAVKWMKDNAASYGIDPERIVLGGHSAGGFLSLATGMFDATDVSTFSDLDLDVSQLEVAAVLDGAGSLMGTEYTIDANDPPTFVLHSEDDSIVVYQNALDVVAELENDNVPYEFPYIVSAGHGLDSKLDTVIDDVLVSDQMFDFFRRQLNLARLEEITWSITASSLHIEEHNDSETITIRLDGTVPENDSVSVRVTSEDITTSGEDYKAPQAAVIDAVEAYDGPGALVYSAENNTLTYTGGQNGTEMTDLIIAAKPVDDELFEQTESLGIGLANPSSSTSNSVAVSDSLNGVILNILDNDGTALDTYIAKPDATYQYSLESTLAGDGYTTYVIDMTSQTWRSSEEVDKPTWKHWVEIVVPEGATSDTAILHIGGGFSSDAPSATDQSALQLALSTNQITVSVPTVPNQRLLFAGENTARQEDAIIAYSFDKYLDGGDDEWPVLLPMVKSAVRAMDTAQEFLQTTENYVVSDFYVTGGSKRGWTTWLTAASDPRVSAMAPVVFDYLNANASVEFHERVYADVEEGVIGGYAEAVFDYYQMGVFARMGTPRSDLLVEIVDPYSYRDRLTMPKYAINSSGDQFMPMASQFYIQDMLGPTYVRYMPNTGHSAGRVEGADFFSVLEANGELPQFSWQFEGVQENTIRLNVVDNPVSIKKWQATNTDNLDFRIDYFGANWNSTVVEPNASGEYLESIEIPVTGGTAFFLELEYEVAGETLIFTTDATIVEALTNNLTFQISKTTVNENDGAQAASGTVSRDGDTDDALVVHLTSDDLTELTVPTSITIAAGAEVSAPFSITALNDSIQDGTQAVAITAEANQYNNASVSIDVEDDEAALTYHWHNEVLSEDVNNDGSVSPLDVLFIINELNQSGSYELPQSKPESSPFFDVNRDGWISPADAIQVINDINGTAYSVKVGISLTDGNGEAISSVQVNEIFYVNLTVEDLTEDAAGVFAIYADLYLQTTDLQYAGSPTYTGPYINGKSGSTDEQGELDEWGAFAGLNRLGAGEILVSSIPVKALKAGSTQILLEGADESPLHDVLLYDRETALGQSEIHYEALILEILDHGEGEAMEIQGEYSSESYADRVDELFAVSG